LSEGTIPKFALTDTKKGHNQGAYRIGYYPTALTLAESEERWRG